MLKQGKDLKIFHMLSIPIIILGIIAAFGGLFFDWLYNDPYDVLVQAIAQDAVTLFVVIPLMVISLYLSMKGSLKGTLVWLGCIGYMLYTYITYTGIASFNEFFLIYVAIYSFSLYTLIGALVSIDPKKVKSQFKMGFNNLQKKIVGGILITLGFLFYYVWLSEIIEYTFIQGDLSTPEIGSKFIYAIDLGFFLPLTILSGVLLIKEKALGYLLSGIVLIIGITIAIAVIVMAIVMFIGGVPSGLELLPIFIFVVTLFLTGEILYLMNIKG